MTETYPYSAPEVDVIVVNWNAREELLECVASVFAQRGVALSLTVVDNGSTDDSVAALRSRFPAANVLETGDNLGFAEACNRGIARTGAPWLFLLNNDARLEPEALERLVSAAKAAAPDVAAMQPALVFKSDVSLLNSAGIDIFADGSATDRGFREPLEAYQEAADVFGVTAGAALYRRSALERVALGSGVFDRRFFMYFEDVDLAWRLRLAGYRALYVPEARAAHRFQGSSQKRGADFVPRHTRRNRLRMLVKNASPEMMVRSLPSSALALGSTLSDEGVMGVLESMGACLGAARERAQVTRLAERDREEIEQRWIRQPTAPLAQRVWRGLRRRLRNAVARDSG